MYLDDAPVQLSKQKMRVGGDHDDNSDNDLIAETVHHVCTACIQYTTFVQHVNSTSRLYSM